MKTVNDILTEYIIDLDKKIEKAKNEIPLDEEMIKKNPKDDFFKWEEVLERDKKELNELRELKGQLKNYITNNWRKLEKMEIK